MNILWKQPDGILALTILTGERDSPEDHAQELIERGDIPADWKLIGTRIDWPETGWPHEAHRWDGQKIVVDLNAAKECHKAWLRQQREPMLVALDVQFMRALEKGQPTTAITAEKQRLRDIPSLVDACTTLSQVSAVLP